MRRTESSKQEYKQGTYYCQCILHDERMRLVVARSGRAWLKPTKLSIECIKAVLMAIIWIIRIKRLNVRMCDHHWSCESCDSCASFVGLTRAPMLLMSSLSLNYAMALSVEVYDSMTVWRLSLLLPNNANIIQNIIPKDIQFERKYQRNIRNEKSRRKAITEGMHR